jgi:hypothetical protein
MTPVRFLCARQENYNDSTKDWSESSSDAFLQAEFSV